MPFVERVLGVQFLDKSVYYISELPSEVQRGDVLTVATIALVLTLSGHALPELARGADQSGGGAAL